MLTSASALAIFRNKRKENETVIASAATHRRLADHVSTSTPTRRDADGSFLQRPKCSPSTTTPINTLASVMK